VQIAELAKSEPCNDSPNDAQNLHWCFRFLDMRACNCSSRKSHAGARLAITVFESGANNSEVGGRMVSTLLL
jgi:hypothetical protein